MLTKDIGIIRYGKTMDEMRSDSPVETTAQSSHLHNLKHVQNYFVQVWKYPTRITFETCWLLWHFQVRAVCKVSASIPENVETLVEESQLWSTLSFTTRPSTPDPPGVNSQTESTIKILWRAAQGSNTSFEVEYGRDGSSHRRHTKGNSLTLTGTVDCPSGTTIIPHHIYHASSTASCKKWWKVIGRVSQKVTKL